MQIKDEIVVLGLGNKNYGDDAVGVAVAEILRKEKISGIKVVCGGINGDLILRTCIKAKKLLILVCFEAGGKPGSIYRYTLDELLENIGEVYSLYQFGLLSFLKQIESEKPKEVIIIGIEPKDLARHAELSSRVLDLLDSYLEKIRSEIVRWIA